MQHKRNIKNEMKNQNKRAISRIAVAQFQVNHTPEEKNPNESEKKMK